MPGEETRLFFRNDASLTWEKVGFLRRINLTSDSSDSFISVPVPVHSSAVPPQLHSGSPNWLKADLSVQG
ncbi:Uncharacterized protein dnm_038580 [Desulfonema magnum]|uniref:Uncharacterized protein n=1 Tax=Desulfonema magnum TaxID=45655 RepID=A0A975GNC7_9BACT|nr:Uncharacterized protein dnm_038580 [Desulfonema magnum]